jgi:hypothetical protein
VSRYAGTSLQMIERTYGHLVAGSVESARARMDELLAASEQARVVGVESENVTPQEDIAAVAGQLAELTRTVEVMAKDLKAMTDRADRQQARADHQQELVDSQQERAQLQQERIDRAAKELADVSDRLQAAADALREAV